MLTDVRPEVNRKQLLPCGFSDGGSEKICRMNHDTMRRGAQVCTALDALSSRLVHSALASTCNFASREWMKLIHMTLMTENVTRSKVKVSQWSPQNQWIDFSHNLSHILPTIGPRTDYDFKAWIQRSTSQKPFSAFTVEWLWPIVSFGRSTKKLAASSTHSPEF